MRRVGLLCVVVVLASPRSFGDPPRLHTDRPLARPLALPLEADAFGFLIFGDRTNGPDSGLAILRQAVADANLLDPDFVMTVGDLVQGYNTREPWLEQAKVYKSILAELRMPWFPVAGNHDIYWRGEGRPANEHEGDFEEHFGPLWYAFEHKDCWFVVLHSDEGDPTTGVRDFNDLATQRVSDAQFAFLRDALVKARSARHVFVFLHHPRWIAAKYGDDWQKVHRELVAAGNVRAVFAGHIHKMRYDGAKDGIEYFTLAATGGSVDADLPRAGYLHEMHWVTVRPSGIRVAALPVGAVIDPRTVTPEVSADVYRLDRDLKVVQTGVLAFGDGLEVDGEWTVKVANPVTRPIEITLEADCADRRWLVVPDHVHVALAASATTEITLRVRRFAAAPDVNFAIPSLTVSADYLGEGVRHSIPPRSSALRIAPPPWGDAPPTAGALAFDGERDAVRIDSRDLRLEDGPFTVEARFRARDLAGRRAVVAKTQSAEFGILVNDGTLGFAVHLDGRYVRAEATDRVIERDRWYHVAGVYDGREVHLYLDGERVASATGSGARTRNDEPLWIGADPDGDERTTAHFEGDIGDVAIVPRVLYGGARVESRPHASPPKDALLWLPLDARIGPWVRDAASRGLEVTVRGDPRVTAQPSRISDR